MGHSHAFLLSCIRDKWKSDPRGCCIKLVHHQRSTKLDANLHPDYAQNAENTHEHTSFPMDPGRIEQPPESQFRHVHHFFFQSDTPNKYFCDIRVLSNCL